MRSTILVAGLFALCAVPTHAVAKAAAASPSAQPAANPNVTISGWRLECDPGKSKLACRVLNQIAQASNGALILGFTLNPAADGKTHLTLQVPLGAAVSAPVVVSAGGGSQTFPYLTCSQQGCFATAAVQDALLSAMRNDSAELHVAYTLFDANLTSHDVTVNLPLSGFAEVDDKLR